MCASTALVSSLELVQFRTCQHSEFHMLGCYRNDTKLVPSDHCFVSWEHCESGNLHVISLNNVTTEICTATEWLWACREPEPEPSTIAPTTTSTIFNPTSSTITEPPHSESCNYSKVDNPFLWCTVILALLVVLIFCCIVYNKSNNSKIYPGSRC